MAESIRIPKLFYEDHCERMTGEGYTVLESLRATKRHYHLAPVDSLALRFLVWDCEYYDDFWLHEDRSIWPYCHSARATHKAIKRAMGWDPDEDLARPPEGAEFESLRRARSLSTPTRPA